MNSESPSASHLQQATFGGGCFWCTEAVFDELAGVEQVVSGYSGGSVENPTYRQVCNGETGHVEVIQITFDPAKISYQHLLEVFFATHDPTTPNRQGNDVGSQYRSVIFFHDEKQREIAESIIQQLEAAGIYPSPIVTSIDPLINFFPAEDYHQEYFALNGHEPYCQMIIRPKVEKVRKVFRESLKSQ